MGLIYCICHLLEGLVTAGFGLCLAGELTGALLGRSGFHMNCLIAYDLQLLRETSEVMSTRIPQAVSESMHKHHKRLVKLLMACKRCESPVWRRVKSCLGNAFDEPAAWSLRPETPAFSVATYQATPSRLFRNTSRRYDTCSVVNDLRFFASDPYMTLHGSQLLGNGP